MDMRVLMDEIDLGAFWIEWRGTRNDATVDLSSIRVPPSRGSMTIHFSGASWSVDEIRLVSLRLDSNAIYRAIYRADAPGDWEPSRAVGGKR